MKLLSGFLNTLAMIVPADAGVLEEVGTYGIAGFQHADSLSEIVCLSDGERMLSSSMDQCVRLWEIETGKLLQRYTKSGIGSMWGIRVLPGEKEFLAAGSSGEILRLDLATGQVVKIYKYEGTAYRIALHPDGKRFVGTYDEDVAVLWDLDTGKKIQTYSGHEEDIYTAIISDDGKTLITGSEDGSFKSWDLEKGELLETYRAEGKVKYGDIYTLAKSPDGSRFAMVSDDHSVRVFDIKTMAEVWRKKLPDEGQVVAWSPDGKVLATASDDRNLYLLDSADGSILRKIRVEENAHTPITFTTDGTRVISGGDGILYIYDVETGERIIPTLGAPLHLSGFEHIAVADGGNLLMTAGGSTLHVWDIGNPGVSRDFNEPTEITKMVLSADGKFLALGGDGGHVSIREIGEFDVIRTLDSGDTVRGLAFTPDGSELLTAGDDDCLVVWDLASGRMVTTYRESAGDLTDLVLSPDGQMAVTTGRDNTVRMYALGEGEQQSYFKLTNRDQLSLAYLDGGRSLLVGSDRQELWGRLLPEVFIEPVLNEDEIRFLVAKFAEHDFKMRQEAMDSLVKMGPGVIEILGRSTSDDPEVMSRIKGAEKIVRETYSEKGLKEIYKFEGRVRNLESDPSGRFFAGVEGNGGAAKVVMGEVIAEEVQVRDFLDFGHGASEVAFSPDGKHLATVNGDGTFSLFTISR